MKLRLAPWKGPWFWMHLYLMGIAFANFLNGLVGLLTLGTVSFDHNYFGLADRGMERLERATGNFCDCDDCKIRRKEIIPPEGGLTKEFIDNKMREFKEGQVPIEMVKEYFEGIGVHVDLIEMSGMPTIRPTPKKDTVH